MFSSILIFGTGMIGGSFALAVKRSFPKVAIFGYDKNLENINDARNLGIIDFQVSENELNKIIAQVELIIIATPLNSYGKIFQQISQALINIPTKSQPIITDVGSSKTFVIAQAKKYLKEINIFIPAHPIAGLEKSGPQYATPDLFCEHYLLITPLTKNRDSDVKQIKNLWHSIGALVEIVSPKNHDEICAGISHLPHLLSMALVHYLMQKENSEEYLKYAAGGFRDFTRIAGSDAQMWHDVFIANKKALLGNLSQLEKSLKIFRKMIKNNKEDNLKKELFTTLQLVTDKRKKWKQK